MLLAGPSLPPLPGIRAHSPPPCCRTRREFELWRYTPPAGTAEALPPPPGPLLVLVQHGELRARAGAQARTLRRGDVYFLAAGAELELEAPADALVWMVACNAMGFE